MSDYDDLKKELHRVSHSVSVKNREIQQLSDELKTIEKEKEAARSSSDVSLKTDYNNKYKQHLDSIIGPIDKKIANTRKELEKENTEFKSEFDSLTEEKFIERCTDTTELLKQVQEMSSELRVKLQNLVGPRLYKSVTSNLKAVSMKLDVSDLDRVITYFNECEDKVTTMLERPDFIGDTIKGIEDRLQSIEGGDVQSKGVSIFLCIVMIVLVFVLYKFVFPFYVIFILMIGAFHLCRTYSVYEILLVQKAIIDNIDSITNKLHEQAKYEAEKARAELQQKHQATESALKAKLDDLIAKQNNAVNASKQSFYYDGASIKSALNSKLVNLEKREADAVTSRSVKMKELDALTQELNEIKSHMDGVFSSQQNEYLNYEKAGESFILDRKFLLDIDDVSRKLSFFELHDDSSLFIYKDREEAINFIKLINVQVRCRLHPSCYEVVYYDDINVGQDCLFFVPETKEKNDLSSRLFRIVSTAKDLTDVIDSYTSEMKARQKNFRQDGNIDAYNEHMLKIDSLPMPYYFMFVLDPPNDLVKKLGAITRAAGMYGIYIFTFVSESTMLAGGSHGKEIVDVHSYFYAIANESVNSRAKSFILDQYCNKK